MENYGSSARLQLNSPFDFNQWIVLDLSLSILRIDGVTTKVLNSLSKSALFAFIPLLWKWILFFLPNWFWSPDSTYSLSYVPSLDKLPSVTEVSGRQRPNKKRKTKKPRTCWSSAGTLLTSSFLKTDHWSIRFSTLPTWYRYYVYVRLDRIFTNYLLRILLLFLHVLRHRLATRKLSNYGFPLRGSPSPPITPILPIPPLRLAPSFEQRTDIPGDPNQILKGPLSEKRKRG